MIYDNLKKNNKSIREINNNVLIHFINGPFVEIKGPKKANYKVDFINNKTGQICYTTSIDNNCWCRCSIQYFIEWKIVIYENGVEWYSMVFNAEGKRVYIAMDSKALGDSLAWIPYVQEFKKQHKCEVIVSTFMNDMFLGEYPDIEFVQPGTPVPNLYAMYSVGLFYNENGSVNGFKNPVDPKSVTMQKMKPKVKQRPVKIDNDIKQVCIATYGTAQSKFWNNPTGWQEVVDWLIGRGYLVKLLSKEGDNYMGNKLPIGVIHQPNGPIDLVMDEMKKSKAFIGIGSGLIWLSWALDVPTVLISGFSYRWAEMEDCIRIGAPEGKCEGCFNRIKLDAGDWNWCPDHKGTERQFECTKSITSEMVIKELEKFL